ncbi:hypothetical protein B0G76_7335 [Paraburkholderia sp. BL23I1N1]|nr:hypothetical protein B0G76_7335 [Paraburkholderia sp. BL23I1N1]
MQEPIRFAAPAAVPTDAQSTEANAGAEDDTSVMRGFPPAPENQVTLHNASSPRFLRWSLMNGASLHPTVRVLRGEGTAMPLPAGEPFDPESLGLDDECGDTLTVERYFRECRIDAMLIMHRGRIVYERYLGEMRPNRLHSLFSSTKSLIGTLIAVLAHDGVLDLNATAATYVPELAHSALGSATLQQLLDMRANFRFGEQMHLGDRVQVDFHQALGVLGRPADYDGPDGAYALLKSAKPAGEHGIGPFRYDNGSTETLGWVARRATGRPLAQLLGERFWEPLGAQQDADLTLDCRKSEWAAAGMSTNLRDLARFGEMMRLDGTWQGRQIVPRAVVSDIRRGGDRAAYAASGSTFKRPGGSYRNQWWVHHDRYDSFSGNGHFGQCLWIAPKGETVIARFASDPQPTGTFEASHRRVGYAVIDALQAR